MGIRQIIIAVNKMDKIKDSKYSENRFIKIKKYMVNICKNIGFSINNIQIVPYSGYTGQSLVNRYEDKDNSHINKMNWYKGKTLLESLDELRPSKKAFNAPLKKSIFQSCYITEEGTVLEGKILSDKLNKEIDLCIPLNDKITKSKCYSILIHDNKYDEAFAGDIIDFNIKGIKENDVCYFKFNENTMTNIKSVDNLRVKILMINKNTK